MRWKYKNYSEYYCYLHHHSRLSLFSKLIARFINALLISPFMKLICDETDRRKPSYQKKRASHFLAAFLIRQLCLDNFVHTIIYVHTDFTWDPIKDGINKSKHGISFETASLVFSDPLHMSVLHRVVNGEQRWKTMGLVGGPGYHSCCSYLY